MRVYCVCLVSLMLLVECCVSSRVEEAQVGNANGGIQGRLHGAAVYFKHLVNRLPNSYINPSSLKPINRVKRLQVELSLNRCENDADCVSYVNVSSELVRCDISTGLCICNDCFVRLNDTCQVVAPSCRNYSEDSGQCVDQRKSQETALLLTLFLSSVGAANFYIGQNLFGGLQLGLLVFSIVLTLVLVCAPWCGMAYCMQDDDVDDIIDSIPFMCYVLGVVIVDFILLLIIASWWIADVTVFAYNSRLDGNGCPLLSDL